ncbi:replication protein [Chloroflexota bacterium]
MPKGDRKILKADPEDGTTPVANLLLEALVIAKLTSKERAACLFLIRRTYGWQINGSLE